MARSLFSAGINLLSLSPKAVLSDDEAAEDKDIDNVEYIDNGMRGILVFKAYSVKSDRHKILHLNLYKGLISQYTDTCKRTYSIEDVQRVSRNKFNHVVVEVKRLGLTQQKAVLFESDEIAASFHQYVEFLKESGGSVKTAFRQIDYMRMGFIDYHRLQKAMARVDLRVSQADTLRMLSLSTGEADRFDYQDFLHLFVDSFVSDLRQCLEGWLNRATDQHDSLSRVDTALSCLSGETIAYSPSENVHWSMFLGKSPRDLQISPGVLYVTNYRVVVKSLRRRAPDQSEHSRFEVPPFFSTISIPLACLLRIYSASPRSSLYLVCKDHRTVRITLSGAENGPSYTDTLLALLTQAFSKEPLFAFQNLTYFKGREESWESGDVMREYERQGICAKNEWKIVANTDYALSPSYPQYIVLPQAFTPAETEAAAEFRSRRRIPAVTYMHNNSAVLLRSAQPMVGFGNKNSAADQRLLNLYRCQGRELEEGSTENQLSKLYILDARGKVAATINMALGKGTEDASLYPNTELIFCNIDNIHVMRSSAAIFAEALGHAPAHADSTQQLEGVGGFHSKLEESGWLRHSQMLLVSGSIAAEKLHYEGASVLVHCSDGWDRTAQICSIAQLILDPHLRTIEGLSILIEKEWCAFGHKFQDRCGHGLDSNVGADERSPVFLQFLDVLYQLTVQFPRAFDFNDTLLLFLADHLHSCLFGNFLGNSDAQRVQLGVRQRTRSLWSHVRAEANRGRFSNAQYSPYDQPIWPSTRPTAVQVWQRFWLRWDPDAHPHSLSGLTPWHDDWGMGAETDHMVRKTSYAFVAKPLKSPALRLQDKGVSTRLVEGGEQAGVEGRPSGYQRARVAEVAAMSRALVEAAAEAVEGAFLEVAAEVQAAHDSLDMGLSCPSYPPPDADEGDVEWDGEEWEFDAEFDGKGGELDGGDGGDGDGDGVSGVVGTPGWDIPTMYLDAAALDNSGTGASGSCGASPVTRRRRSSASKLWGAEGEILIPGVEDKVGVALGEDVTDGAEGEVMEEQENEDEDEEQEVGKYIDPAEVESRSRDQNTSFGSGKNTAFL